MEILIEKKIRKKFHQGFERTKPVSCLVIHGTGGPNTLKWMHSVKERSSQGKRYSKGIALFHYLIRRDGEIWNIIDTARWVHHASINMKDEYTIGIELVNNLANNDSDYTEQQYKSLFSLINFSMEKFPGIQTIISHNKVKFSALGEGKRCPGPLFKWHLLAMELSKKFSFKQKEEKIYQIEKLDKQLNFL